MRAEKEVVKLSRSYLKYMRQLSVEKDKIDLGYKLSAARKEGREEGLIKGREEGHIKGHKEGHKEGHREGRLEELEKAEKESISRAKEMIQDKLPIEVIERYTGLPLEKIEALM